MLFLKRFAQVNQENNWSKTWIITFQHKTVEKKQKDSDIT